ncbi:Protein phosphatase 1G-like [Tropilaelaps mercedesae]|uniref:Protein phosphatase 1G-like n=1 Tax=Tropilaelaps mercedesae TaxID=418985 RepID=A0A1V9WYB8_9ACAR|nr:Protein phosphatase 1G-like [Tropilaelaps mercedesae]
MGAYLSRPIFEPDTACDSGRGMAFGASSVQGWRVTQEDAHNCILDYDTDCSLFAVYDGHGGSEVRTHQIIIYKFSVAVCTRVIN